MCVLLKGAGIQITDGSAVNSQNMQALAEISIGTRVEDHSKHNRQHRMLRQCSESTTTAPSTLSTNLTHPSIHHSSFYFDGVSDEEYYQQQV